MPKGKFYIQGCYSPEHPAAGWVHSRNSVGTTHLCICSAARRLEQAANPESPRRRFPASRRPTSLRKKNVYQWG